MGKYSGNFPVLIIFIVICSLVVLPARVSAVSPDYDAEYNAQWGLEAINAAPAYKLGYTGAGIVVGIADTGINASHREFINRKVLGVQKDSDLHGTHVSGIIGAARDGYKMHGVAYDAQLMVYMTTETEEEIIYSVATNIMTDPLLCGGKIPAIINCSWGYDYLVGDVKNQSKEALLKDAEIKSLIEVIDKAVNQNNQLIVCAAGNMGYDNPQVPPGLPYLFPELNLTKGLVAVVAVDESGITVEDNEDNDWASNKAGVAKYWVISAPGMKIFAPLGDDEYSAKSGTSAAAPHVSGAAALVWQAFPEYTNAQIAQMLFLTADNSGIYSDMATYGWGLLNVGNAVQGIITRNTLDFDEYAGKFVLVVPIARKDLGVTVQKSNLVLEEDYTFSKVEVSDGGILTVNQNLDKTPVTIDANSFLKGSGTISNSTVDIDGGTLAPGNSPGVLTLQNATVDFYGGTFQPFLSNYGYSQLLLMADSKLNLSGNINIDPEFPQGYQVKIGGKYTVLQVQDTSTVNYDSGSSFRITQLTEPAIRYNAINAGNEFNLYITPANYTDTAAIGLHFDENQAQMAPIWENNRPQADIVDLSGLTKEQQDIYPLIYSLDAPSLRQSASQMSGQLIADTRAGTLNQLRSLNESLHEMNENNETVKIFRQKLKISDGQFSGGNLTSSGVIINHPFGFDEKSNYGVGVSFVSGKQRGNYDLGQGTIDSYSLHLYKNTYQPNGKYWFGQLGLGQTRQEIDRQISGASSLNSSGTGSHFFAGLGAGKKRDIGTGNLKLEAALFWENAKNPAISETGNETFSLKGESGRDNRIGAELSLKRKHILKDDAKLTTAIEANLGISHDFKELQNHSVLEGFGTRLNIKSEKLGATALKYGLGFSWNWNKSRELKLAVSGEKRSNATKGSIELFYKMKY